jgi:hypothetical protein
MKKKFGIEILLFLKPKDEFSEEEVADPTKFRRKVDALCDHLKSVAKIVEKLHNADWWITRGLYELSITPPTPHTKAEARKRLRQLGIDMSSVNFHELKDEEFEYGVEDVEEDVRAGGKR